MSETRVYFNPCKNDNFEQLEQLNVQLKEAFNGLTENYPDIQMELVSSYDPINDRTKKTLKVEVEVNVQDVEFIVRGDFK